jgi:hypothetical protein
MTGEATDALLAKIFDGPSGELSSNLGELDVEVRRTKAAIARNIVRLKNMNKPAQTGSELPV